MNSMDAKYEPLKELSMTLDELLGCQKEEQTVILNRQTALLTPLNHRMNFLTQKVESLERSLKGVWPEVPLPNEYQGLGHAVFEKLKQLQEVTLQNHLLLENSLRFLQEIFDEVIGKQDRAPIYNQFGALPFGLTSSGSFLNTQV